MNTHPAFILETVVEKGAPYPRDFRPLDVSGKVLGATWGQVGSRSSTKNTCLSATATEMAPKRRSDRDNRNGSMSFGRPKTIKSVKLSAKSLFFKVRRKDRKCHENGAEIEPE